jgi:2-amino-4-hydroxy-6-hydroxymethyldihydropteridine diphosphokinase
MAHCLIGLGANLGDRSAQLSESIARLCGHPQIECLGHSQYHTTPAIGGPAGQEPFLNAAVRIATDLTPPALLAVARDVEQQLGRQRRERWGPRSIDIDILLYDRLVVQADELIVPHPRMAFRRFVLEPACEVAGDMIHPITQWTVAQLLDRLRHPPHYVAIFGLESRQTANLAQAAAAISGARLWLDPAPPPPSRAGAAEFAQRELQSIRARGEQLAELAASCGTSATDWHICNYWLPQSLAVARAWLPDALRQEVARACQSAVARLPGPHCALFLVPPAAASAAAAPHGSTGDALPPAVGNAPALARELSHQASLPHQAPLLRIDEHDLPLALTELTAAIDAMR